VGFATFSFTGLLLYRQIDRLPYPLPAFGLTLAAMVVSFVGWDAATSWTDDPLIAALAATALWIGWAAYLLTPLLRDLRTELGFGGSR
jgi:hypothetical protein